MATTITTSQTASTLPQKKGDPPNFGTVKSGRALAFDGVVDILEDSSTYSFENKSSITIACWVNIDAYANNDYIISLPDIVSGHNGVDIRLNASGNILFHINTHSANGTVTYTSGITGKWYRAVLTYDGTNLKGYLDGSLVGTTAVALGSGIEHASGKLCIGSFSSSLSGYNFAGKLSDLQIWDTAWTLSDVQNDYRHPEMLAYNFSSTSLTESNLKVWYPMTEGNPESPQTTIFDGSPKVLGSELITNGGFDTNSNWTATNFTIADGVATTSTSGAELHQNLAISSEDTIKIVAEIKNYTSGSVRFYTGHGDDNSASFSGNGVYTHYLKANNAKVFFYSDSFVGSLDNVSVKKVQRGNHAKSFFYGDEMITDAKNREFTGGHDWGVYDPESGGSVTVGLRGGKLEVVTSANAEKEGAVLAVPEKLNTALVVGKTYRVTASLDSTAGATTPTIICSLGGLVATDSKTISTTEASYDFDIIPTNTTGDLMFYTDSGTATTFTIEDVTVREVGLSNTGHVEGQETIFQPAFVGQSRKKVFGHTATYADFTDITNINDGKSISLWFNPQDNLTKGLLIGTHTTQSNICLTDSTSIQMEDDANTITLDWTVPTMSVGNWYHLVIVFNDNDGYSLYMNGSFISTQDNDSFSGIDIDRIGGGSGGGINNFNGIIDEISYWTKELTLADVQEMYNDGVPLDLLTHSSTSDLDNYWRNNNLHTDGKWKDLKGSNHVTFNATNDYEIVLPEGTTSGRDINGFFLTHPNKNYLSLDGQGAYLDIAHSSVFNFANDIDFTIEFWTKVNNINDNFVFIEKVNAYYGLGFAVYMNDAGSNQFNFIPHIEDASNTASGNSSTARNCHTWYYYCATFDRSGNVTNYVGDSSTAPSADGTTDISGVNATINNTEKIQLGRWTTSYSDIMIDDVRIYNRLLSTSEIKKNWRHGSGKHKD